MGVSLPWLLSLDAVPPSLCLPARRCRRYVAADELIEVTPGQLRLRKRTLESGKRRSAKRREDSVAA